MKELKFKKISIAQICSAIVSAVIGISLAFSGFGVWALVYSSLAATLTNVLIFWYKSVWYPQWVFSYASISKMVPFGLNVLASSVLYFFLQQFNSFIVGKYYSKTDLGLFNRGMKFPDLISSIIQGVVLKMAFPLFAKLQNDDLQLKNVLRKSSRMVAFISFPLLTFMFVDAKEIIVFLLTDKWLGAVIYLKIFCLVSLLTPFISLQRELLLAKGKANLLFRLFIVTTIFEIIPILIVVRYDIIYVVWISLISKVFQYFLYQVYSAKKMKISLGESVKWLTPFLLIVLFIGAAIETTTYLLPEGVTNNLFLKLTIDFLLGAGLYFFFLVKFKFDEIQTLTAVLNSFIKKPKVA